MRAPAAIVPTLGVIVLWGAAAAAQPTRLAAGAMGSASRPSAVAAPVEAEPALDGDVLGDPSWQSVPAITNFWQERPDEGHPASERTEARLAFTEHTLFVGVVCYDREPRSIIVSDSRRDTSLEETDSFQIIFDTYRDGLNGFVFGTNPAGIEYDGQVTNEGQGGGGLGPGQSQMTGSGGGFNLNRDGAWEVRTNISDIG